MRKIISVLLSCLICFSVSFSQQTDFVSYGQIDLNVQLKGKLKKNGFQKVKITITNHSDSSIFIESWKVIQNNPIGKFDCSCYGIPSFCLHYWSFLLFQNGTIVDCEVVGDFEPSLPEYSPDDDKWYYNKDAYLNKREFVEIKAGSLFHFTAFLYVNPTVAYSAKSEFDFQICYCGAPSAHQPRLSKLKIVSNWSKN